MDTSQTQTAAAPPPATPSERRTDYEDAIGKNLDYYLKRFDAFDAGTSRAGWNWPAFLVPSWWSLYRKLWLPGILFLVWPLIALILMSISSAFVIHGSMSTMVLVCVIAGAVVLAPYILYPIFANAIYWRRTRRLIEQVSSRFPRDASQQRQARIRRDGGTSVGPMLGIILGFSFFTCSVLAGIAIPAYQDYTVRAQIAEGLNLASAVKADVASYWEEHHAWPEQSDLGDELPSGKYTTQVIVQSGSIVITYGNDANPVLAGQRLALLPGVTANQEIVWACGGVPLPDGATPGEGPQGSDVPNKFLPKACRAP